MGSYNNNLLRIDDEDEAIVHRHQNAELLFYQQVAKGDIEAIRENCAKHEFLNQAGVGLLSKNPLQNLKYHFVVSVALISRLCVDNGMEMEKSYRLSDYYIQQLDDINSIERMEELHDKMVMDYTGKMKIIRQNAGLSRPMTECMNYIYSHLKERITVKDLAEYTSNSASYISRLFKDELGVSTSDYIRTAKLEASKNLLRYSDYSLVDIANYFSFTSQSHFCQLFQKETGLTPKKYREKFYGTHWKGTEADIMKITE
ncbi:AraC-type DNA-binding protein [Pseudobutyrivibrio sp. YE44]|uniref:helix-turn-helix domain-containing protein n=1 Tax=Pseudobutyrivibrio sp. YE44 TaxID=1520802 RepID=UPI000883C929|nr:helix-turn-helix domain-containing protein [Pseudobutyrivibrio sp. YE44]SDB20074.1 AraC-type DNA-binding protein [Pseudobutyrivibrio sp. YE44]